MGARLTIEESRLVDEVQKRRRQDENMNLKRESHRTTKESGLVSEVQNEKVDREPHRSTGIWNRPSESAGRGLGLEATATSGSPACFRSNPSGIEVDTATDRSLVYADDALSGRSVSTVLAPAQTGRCAAKPVLATSG